MISVDHRGFVNIHLSRTLARHLPTTAFSAYVDRNTSRIEEHLEMRYLFDSLWNVTDVHSVRLAWN